MIVRCANCHTEFSLDDHQIGPEGATVRCSVCGYVFPVESPSGSREHPWQIRTVEDLLFTAPSLDTLRMWIEEGRLHPDDQVSRTGRHWIRLGDMPEFSSVFSGFSNLPQVFVELDPSPGGSALDELGPPPGFGETMPVVQGVDTDILVVDDPSSPVMVEDDDPGVAVTSHTAAVERSSESSHSSGARPAVGDTMTDFAEAEDSAVRMRPRPHEPTRQVSAIPDVLEDDDSDVKVRRRPARPTVRYGDDVVQGAASMLAAVTQVVAKTHESEDGGHQVRPTAAAVERTPTGSGPMAWAEGSGAQPSRSLEASSAAERSEGSKRRKADVPAPQSRRRHRTFARSLDPPSRRSTWPWVAALGVVAGVVLIFGLPSVRSGVMAAADKLVGSSRRIDPESVPVLEQARAAMVTLDPVAVGEAEAALQAQLDDGRGSTSGVAQMKLAQAELLATRALEHDLRAVVTGGSEPDARQRDIDRATRILMEVVADDVLDRGHMRRVRALVRLAQGRPPAEINPLLPDEPAVDSDPLHLLVDAAPLWRDRKASVPGQVVAGLEELREPRALVQLVLMVAYARAGDATQARQQAEMILQQSPEQPTAAAFLAQTPSSDGEGLHPDGTGGGGDQTESETESTAAETTGGRPQVSDDSTDALIEQGCALVRKGTGEAGFEALRMAQRRDPQRVEIFVCLGDGFVRQGRAREGLKAFEQALRHSPGSVAALRGAAGVADTLGQTDKALRYYRRMLARRPSDSTALAYVQAHG